MFFIIIDKFIISIKASVIVDFAIRPTSSPRPLIPGCFKNITLGLITRTDIQFYANNNIYANQC